MAKKRVTSPRRGKKKAVSKAKSGRSRSLAVKRASSQRRPKRAPAKPVSDPLDAFVGAAARALELPIDPAWKPAVKASLETTLKLGATFADFPLPDDAEPAPVFTA